jgi:hypothetical protein
LWRKITTLSKLIGNGAEVAMFDESGLEKGFLFRRKQALQLGL